jgi:phenylalanyl-tRNA synthetase beta chain
MKLITPDLTPRKIKIDLDYINKLLGLELSEAEIEKYLAKMGHNYKNKEVFYPAYRNDILHQVDLAEDIAIAYGYDNFAEELPNVSTIGEETKENKRANKIAQIMNGLGLQEVQTYHLSNKNEQILKMQMKDHMKVIELENALTSEYNVLRAWLLPNIMKVLAVNTKKEFPQKIFEVGTIFDADKKINENQVLAGAISHTEANYTEAKQIIEALFSSLGISIEFKAVEHPAFIPGRSATIYLNKQAIGVVGEIHPQVLENWNLEMPVSAFDISLELI